MLTLTLDTNCVIDLELKSERHYGPSVQTLLDMHKLGKLDVALGASSASERQTDLTFLRNESAFRKRVESFGFVDIEFVRPLARWDISFWNSALWSSPELAERENEISRALFPYRNLLWADAAKASNVDPDDMESSAYQKWRNQLLDVQAYWAHEHAKRDIFVTGDKNFARKLTNKPKFPEAKIMTPLEAVNFAAENMEKPQ